MTQEYADYISRQLEEGGMKRIASGGGLEGFKKRPGEKSQTGLDSVKQSELQGKHSDREDPDVDNDGDVDDSDEYLHNRRKKVSKAIQKKNNRQRAVGVVVKHLTTSYDPDDDDYDIDESMTVHLKPHPSGTHYVVHKLGARLKAHGGLKVGEKISDTAVDDLGDSGVKVKHMGEQFEEDDYVNEAPLPGEKISGGTWHGRRKNVSGTKKESDEINKEMKVAADKRTQAWKDKSEKDGYKPVLNKTDPDHIQAEPSKDDPKPWVRTAGRARPHRKDKKPAPLADVSKAYNKKYPNAAKSRQIDLDNRLRDREGGNVKEGTAADKYASFISNQIQRADPLNPLNSVVERARTAANSRAGKGGENYRKGDDTQGTGIPKKMPDDEEGTGIPHKMPSKTRGGGGGYAEYIRKRNAAKSDIEKRADLVGHDPGEDEPGSPNTGVGAAPKPRDNRTAANSRAGKGGENYRKSDVKVVDTVKGPSGKTYQIKTGGMSQGNRDIIGLPTKSKDTQGTGIPKKMPDTKKATPPKGPIGPDPDDEGMYDKKPLGRSPGALGGRVKVDTQGKDSQANKWLRQDPNSAEADADRKKDSQANKWLRGDDAGGSTEKPYGYNQKTGKKLQGMDKPWRKPDTQGTGIPKKITPPPDTQGSGIPKKLPDDDDEGTGIPHKMPDRNPQGTGIPHKMPDRNPQGTGIPHKMPKEKLKRRPAAEQYASFISNQLESMSPSNQHYKPVEENMLGFQGAQALGKSRDERHKDAAAHIDYHVRQNPDYHNASDGGDKDRMRHAAAKKLGYSV